MEHIRKTKKRLGVGARGIVYEGYDAERGRFVAVKEIPLFDGDNNCCDSPHSSSNGFGNVIVEGDPVLVEERRAIVREISLMERFEHPNLVAYYGARRSAVGVQIIMEYVNGGSLDALIRRHGCLRESVVRSYTRDITEGLAYLHDTARVCHRDVKPANVLITADGRCKLTDFGVSKLLDDNGTMRTTVGTPWYMAPEVINGTIEEEEEEQIEEYVNTDGYTNSNSMGTPTKRAPSKRSYTTAADIWSLGVTVFEMISGRKPFGQEMKAPAAVLFAIASADPTPPRLPDTCDASSSLRGFLDLCFVRDARLRPSARELLSHQWFLESHTPRAVASVRKTSMAPVARSGSRSSGSGVTDAHSLRPKQQQQQQQQQQQPLSLLSMLDTADLINDMMDARRVSVVPLSRGPVRPPHLTSEMLNAATPAKACFCSVKDSHGGFWSSDGHYVDLIVTSPLGGMHEKREKP